MVGIVADGGAQLGAAFAVMARREDKLAEVVSRIQSSGGRRPALAST